MDEVLRHLIHGWQGFVGIIAKAANAGAVIPTEEIERLERMQAELATVIAKQRKQGSTDG